MSATPPRLYSSFRSSASIDIRSLVGSRSSLPASLRSRSSCRRSIRFLIVLKLVSRPPSQRRFTYGIPQRSAHSWIESRACFLVPTKRIDAALRGDLGDEVARLLEQLLGLQQVDDVDPVPLAVDEAAHARVPAPRLVAEVNSSLQQLLDAYVGHLASQFACCLGGCLDGRPWPRRRIGDPGALPGQRPVLNRRGLESGQAGHCRGAVEAVRRSIQRRPQVLEATTTRTSFARRWSGARKLRRAECRNWRERPWLPLPPYSGSPATGWPIAAKWTRTW